MTPPPSPPPIKIHQWILDTRPLWPVIPTAASNSQMSEFKIIASHPLSLLPTPDQASILKFYHVRDAKMALASALLKRLVITTLSPSHTVPWPAAVPSRGTNGKPCFVGPDGQKVEFNVSHQAGLVTVIACACAPGEPEVELGTDVVCVNERDDYGRIEREGFFAWVDMHADVFGTAEVQASKMGGAALELELEMPLEGVQMAGYARDGIARCQRGSGPDIVVVKGEGGGEGEKDRTVTAKMVVEAKLRRFYALWCLREAYVKMTGEALLAEWLGELEFRTYRTPKGAVACEGEEQEEATLKWGEVEPGFEIWFKGRKVDDVVMELRALGKDYMVASAARWRGGGDPARLSFVGFKEVDLDRDVYPIATTQ